MEFKTVGKMLVRKLRIYAMLMRLKEIEEEHREKLQKLRRKPFESEPLIIKANPYCNDVNIYLPNINNQPNKHRNKRPFHQ